MSSAFCMCSPHDELSQKSLSKSGARTSFESAYRILPISTSGSTFTNRRELPLCRVLDLHWQCPVLFACALLMTNCHRNPCPKVVRGPVLKVRIEFCQSPLQGPPSQTVVNYLCAECLTFIGNVQCFLHVLSS